MPIRTFLTALLTLSVLACAGPEGVVTREHHLGAGGRIRNKRRSMSLLLDLLRRVVEGLEV